MDSSSERSTRPARPYRAASNYNNSMRSVPRMTEEEVDAVIENFARADEGAGKTWTRLVVEKFLSNRSWYFPRKGFPNAPSLSKAYAYYEHITLPRHFVGEQQAEHIQRRAEPGESAETTKLYNPLTMPSSSLIEWGIGIDLYFSTLRLMAAALLMAGLLHLPNAIFYASDDYNPDGKSGGLSTTLRGSAVCTTKAWVACADCPAGEFDQTRFLTAQDGTILVLRNLCDGGEFPQGVLNWVVLLCLLVVVALIAVYIRVREVRFDEDKVSASDYTVIVKNPPKDALDPDEWRDFFTQFTERQVTGVTIALNNQLLVRKLIYRRVHRNNLRLKLGKGIDMDDEDVVRTAVARLVQERDLEPRGCLHKLFDCTVLPILRLFGMFLAAETLVDRVFELTEEIKELQQEKYDATKVFVTFETEEGQRAALSALSVGKLDTMMSNTHNLAPSAIFQGTVLIVEEPSEPSAIRWLDLHTSKFSRFFWRLLNLGITIGIVAAAGRFVSYVRFTFSTTWSAPLVSFFNSVIPQVVKILMIFEPHHTEGSYQTSLYLKITLFRWVNTALLTKFLTPFTNTLNDGDSDVLPQINNILWSELWLVPLLRLLDITSNLKKHILAPRARNQELMNLNFQGTRYNLGERYTDLTKVLFVAFFYSALYPTTFFFAAAILAVQYYTDKFCLIRIWSWSPFLGNELAKFSRRYFFSGSILAYALVSAYAWAQFPYDNVCDNPNGGTGASGVYSRPQYKNGTLANFDIEVLPEQDEFVQFCGQGWRDFQGFPFPPTSRVQPDDREWMGDSQTLLADFYGWTALVMALGFIVVFFGGKIRDFFMSWFRGMYEPSGQDQHIDFSANEEIFAYVPQIRWGGFPFPFLACDINHIDQGLIGWTDPAHDYDFYNLIYDIPWEGMPQRGGAGLDVLDENDETEGEQMQSVELKSRKRPIFSTVAHYPPPWKEKLLKEKTS